MYIFTSWRERHEIVVSRMQGNILFQTVKYSEYQYECMRNRLADHYYDIQQQKTRH